MKRIRFSSRPAGFHLPGLFEFYDFYRVFLPIFRDHPEFFYDWAEIASIYGAPRGSLWGGGRVSLGQAPVEDALALVRQFGISPRLTFSNSLLEPEHLSDPLCNRLCRLSCPDGGVIVHSELLLNYLRKHYPSLEAISSTTKVLTDFQAFEAELSREEFSCVVADFRLNRRYGELAALPQALKDKAEFLCNECCPVGCRDRLECYRAVSRKTLGLSDDFACPNAGEGGYRFSKAMESPAFLGLREIREFFLPNGFHNFKIEGRTLGSALLLEFLLYYLAKPEHHIRIRERMYLDSDLDLF